ncbi:MAG: hypothetical protein N2316_10555 [Spirochaetes bacterium]|nr:hypothetical protein [Spirochaetota bacterium]
MNRTFGRFSMLWALMLTVLPVNAIGFNDVIGTWRLHYRGNYGYEFSFNKSYRAVCVVRLKEMNIYFRGVYTIDERKNLRINISEIKNQEYGTGGKYNAVSLSYFVFDAKRYQQGGKEYLELRPVEIVINGNSSEGYFEPIMKLVK